MSYDLYVVRRDIPENFWDYGYDPDYDYGCYFNYTYNLGPFFAAYHVRPSTDLDGKTGIEPEARNRQGSIKPNALPHCPSKRAAWFSPATPSTSMTRICANSSKRQGEMMEDRKLVDFARWLNDHPGEWNLWPYLIPIQADRRDTAASMRLVMDRIKNHRYDEFRVDTVLLEYELFNGFMGFDNGGVHENGLALKMRLKA